MELVLNNNFDELSIDELSIIDGGVNWDRVFGGASTFLGATLAVASMSNPVTVGVAATYYTISAVSGAYIGYGLRSKSK